MKHNGGDHTGFDRKVFSKDGLFMMKWTGMCIVAAGLHFWGFWFAQKKRVLKIKVLKPVDEIMLNKKSRAKFLLDGFLWG